MAKNFLFVAARCFLGNDSIDTYSLSRLRGRVREGAIHAVIVNTCKPCTPHKTLRVLTLPQGESSF
jgi:hypothetical protein